uniref:DUF202 domain-containing protein n=1 Tax=Timspurckia oligopyrenoides TaxID=708627 RepID=A0A7S0ZB64_9RHOD|mmetsp:Transcript_10963/g.19816  ORF Transcript_10963/g.19816 Transcript_10963/m.19816 type:complete len:153 (+) Transcript_10963:78-536(+)
MSDSELDEIVIETGGQGQYGGIDDTLDTSKATDNNVTTTAKGNDLKTNMGNERTFFKWMFTGLHVGTSSTWILKFFSEPGRFEVWMILIVWIIAFCVVAYGLVGYYRRREAIQMGKTVSEADSPTAVVFLAISSTLTMATIIIYSLYTMDDL